MTLGSLARGRALLILAGPLAAAACDARTTDPATVADATVAVARDSGASLAADAGSGVVDLLEDAGAGQAPNDDASFTWPAFDAAPWPYNQDAAPLPFDASCSDLTLTLDPDASPHTCEVSPAEVACETAADCTVLQIGHCCFTSVYGVNLGSTALCPFPPCVPGLSCSETGFVTEDCQNVPALTDVGVACLDHRCRTFAATSP